MLSFKLRLSDFELISELPPISLLKMSSKNAQICTVCKDLKRSKIALTKETILLFLACKSFFLSLLAVKTVLNSVSLIGAMHVF